MPPFEPALNLLPPMELVSDARTAIFGAEYHLQKIKELCGSPGLSAYWEDDASLSLADRNERSLQINQLHWHLRAFFWELVTAVDTTLHWVNQTYRLGLAERDVTWLNVQRMLSNASLWNTQLEELGTLHDSPWFFEVRQYRNFSHRAFQLIQMEYGLDRQVVARWILPSRKDQAPQYLLEEQLSGCLEVMLNSINRILPT